MVRMRYHGHMATVDIDDELLAILPGAYPAPADQVRELIVLELFRRRTISSGRAAKLLGMRRGEFIRHAGRLGIPFIDFDDIELERELSTSRRLP